MFGEYFDSSSNTKNYRPDFIKKLVQGAVKQAVQRGYKIIEVGTGNSSLGQSALYQKCRFKIAGVDSDLFIIKHYPDEIFENGIQCKEMV